MPGTVGFAASSKLLEKRWHDRQYEQHQQKVYINYVQAEG